MVHPVAALVLAAGREMLGEMENPANSNRHPTVRWYNANVQNLGPAWNYCAAGVTREFWTTAAKPILTGRAYVPWMMQDFLDGKFGGKLLWVDNDVSWVQPGDVVFYDWSKPFDGRKSVWTGNHVGIAEAPTSRREVVVLEHNTSVPGTGNEGTTRKVRDAKYIVAIGRPDWSRVAAPRIPGTNLPLLDIDGDLGGKTIFALGTVMKARGFAVVPSKTVRADLVRAIQTDLRQHGKKDARGKAIVVDGRGFGSNSSGRYPATGYTRTIQALQIGHGVKPSRADGVFDAGRSSEVMRIQRDLNNGGVKDSPLYTH